MRRGGALIAVLFLMIIGIVIASSVLASADAARTSARAETLRTQSRALAWSGIQGLMAELAEQREQLLDGEPPDITPEWDLYTLDDGTRGVIRLIDLDPESLAILEPENAKLDLNRATAEMLAELPGIESQLAQAIVDARESQPFTSVGQLLAVDGIDAGLLYGEPTGESDQLPPELAGDAPVGSGETAGEGIARFLTVFAFDPNVQVGVDGADDYRGNLRVNLDQPWSEDLERAIADRFDQNTARLVQGLMESGQKFERDGEIVRTLVNSGVGADGWPVVFDVFTTSDDQFLPSRVDLNTAGQEVLACVPGITEQQAGAIVEMREELAPDARRSPAWLVSEGLLTPDDFEQAIDWLTTRSTQWRVKLEAGIERGDPLGFDESSPMTIDQLIASAETDPGSDLEHRVVLEAVIDVGSTRPRVAFMREITMLEPALAIHRSLRARDERERPSADGPAGQENDPLAPSDPSESSMFEDDPFLLDDEFLADSGDPDTGLDFDLGWPDEPATSSVDDVPEAGGTVDSREQTEMIDRRIGRWSTRKAGDS